MAMSDKHEKMADQEHAHPDSVPDPVKSTTARIAVIGDSHCRELDKAFEADFPNVQTYIVTVGSQTDIVLQEYRKNIANIKKFDPTFIILHTGHNDLAYHKFKNRNPKDSTQTTKITMDAAAEIRSNHPKAITIVSAVFPRLLSVRSQLRQMDLFHYNRTAERHTRRLVTEAKKIGMAVFKNNFVWKNKTDLLVKTHLFLEDGLHITTAAKKYVVGRWMEQIHSIQQASLIPNA
jgi:hypothetical protein